MKKEMDIHRGILIMRSTDQEMREEETQETEVDQGNVGEADQENTCTMIENVADQENADIVMNPNMNMIEQEIATDQEIVNEVDQEIAKEVDQEILVKVLNIQMSVTLVTEVGPEIDHTNPLVKFMIAELTPVQLRNVIPRVKENVTIPFLLQGKMKLVLLQII